MSARKWNAVAAALVCVGLTGPAAAEDTLRMLPGRPEVKVEGSRLGDVLVGVRGKDVTAFDFMNAISAIESIHVVVDDGAAERLRSTVVTIDLRNRPLIDVVDLIGAAAGVDVEQDANTYRMMAPPPPGSHADRSGLRRAAQRMFEQALTQQGDVKLAASALRGMAELHRLSGDLFTAFSLYETLLTDTYAQTPAARDCELLLADCYAGIGNLQRASKLLRNFVDRSSDPRASERALRRLVVHLAELGRYQSVEDLRGPLTALGPLEAETLKRIGEAAATMLKRGGERPAAVLLRDVWQRHPVQHAVLGPVLALALAMNGDPKAGEEVLTAVAPHLDSIKDAAAAMWAFAEIAAATSRGPETVVFATRAMDCDDAGPEVRRRCHILLGELYRDMGLAERSRSHYYEAELLSSPEDAVDLALRSAAMTLEEGRPDHARLLYQAAGEYRFRKEEADFGVARSLLQAGEPRRALNQVRGLLERELNDDLRERVRLLAVDCLRRVDRFEDAMRVLDGDVTPLEEPQ